MKDPSLAIPIARHLVVLPQVFGPYGCGMAVDDPLEGFHHHGVVHQLRGDVAAEKPICAHLRGRIELVDRIIVGEPAIRGPVQEAVAFVAREGRPQVDEQPKPALWIGDLGEDGVLCEKVGTAGASAFPLGSEASRP